MKLTNKLLGTWLVASLLLGLLILGFVTGSSQSSIVYNIDPSEIDQGVTGNGKTIKAYADAIGAVKKATIKVRHTGIGNTTPYALTTSVTIPSNITLEIEPGAILDGAGTPTIDGPFKAELTKCFGSSLPAPVFGNYVSVIHAQWWDSRGDDSTDDTAAIQAALDCIDASLPLAKTLRLSAGKHLISATLMIHSQGITIQGEGGNYFFQNSDQRNGTILKWTGGASTVMKVTPNLTTRPIIAPKISRISIDGQSLANIGLRIEACTQGVFEHIYVSHCLDKAIHTGETTLVGFVGLNYVHSCMFRDIGIDQVYVTDGDGIVLDGDNATGASTTICAFYDLHIRHYNGVGLEIARGDNNSFFNVAVGRPSAGSGVGIQFSATANIPSVNTNVMFYAVAGDGGVVAEAGTINSVGNAIFGLSVDTGNPAPTIQSGATFYYHQLFDATDTDQTFGENRIKINGSYFDPFKIIGSHTYGINLVEGTYSGGQIRLKNNTQVTARNNADSADVELFRANTDDDMHVMQPLKLNSDLKVRSTTGSMLGTTTAQKLAFWGTTPVAQPAANANTSGANLAQLETEVNELKALLRTVGLMAP